MFKDIARMVLIAAFTAGGCSAVLAQIPDPTPSIFDKPAGFEKPSDNKNEPKSYRDMLEKLRVEREKKDYDDMIRRGEEVLKISEEVETAYDKSLTLSGQDIEKLADVEKIAKKIRDELGGDDDGEDADEDIATAEKSNSFGDLVKTFRSTTAKLVDELKKTTRFTISATAIQATNAVIKLSRFLRLRK